jgi:lipopolysaccharide transport system ATP-binding protein
VEISENDSGSPSNVKTGQPARFIFTVNAWVKGMACDFQIYDSIGQPVVSFSSKLRGPEDSQDSHNNYEFVCEMEELMLLPGRYRIDVAIIGDNYLQDFIEAAAVLKLEKGMFGSSDQAWREIQCWNGPSLTLPFKN